VLNVLDVARVADKGPTVDKSIIRLWRIAQACVLAVGMSRNLQLATVRGLSTKYR
jgi:hypothetical protein